MGRGANVLGHGRLHTDLLECTGRRPADRHLRHSLQHSLRSAIGMGQRHICSPVACICRCGSVQLRHRTGTADNRRSEHRPVSRLRIYRRPRCASRSDFARRHCDASSDCVLWRRVHCRHFCRRASSQSSLHSGPTGRQRALRRSLADARKRGQRGCLLCADQHAAAGTPQILLRQ